MELFDEPPPTNHGKPGIDYSEIAKIGQENPGKWVVLDRDFGNSSLASANANNIRSGRIAGLRNAGEWDAVSRKIDSKYTVWVSYKGES